MNHESVAVNMYAGIGAFAILPALLKNYVANGVTEEILYRGFLCKRLCEKFVTISGMVLQTVLFGLMHNLLFFCRRHSGWSLVSYPDVYLYWYGSFAAWDTQ